MDAGHLDQAETSARRALETDHGDAESHAVLGAVLTARGRAVLREAKGVQDGTLSEMRASR